MVNQPKGTLFRSTAPNWCLLISTMPYQRWRQANTRRPYCRPWIQFFESLQFSSPANTYSKNNDNSGSEGSSGQGRGQIQKCASSERIQSKKQKRSNCCYAYGPMPPEKSELDNKFQTYKGRVVQRGDAAKDDAGSFAVCTEQCFFASHMTATKVLDVISGRGQSTRMRIHQCTWIFLKAGNNASLKPTWQSWWAQSIRNNQLQLPTKYSWDVRSAEA